MDTFSILVGFLIGTATGAAGSYFATKFTEQRHVKEAHSGFTNKLRELEAQMPDLFSEFRADFNDSANSLKREFYVLDKGNMLNVKGSYLVYYHDDHHNLKDMLTILESEGLIWETTISNTDKYEFHSDFIKYVKGET